jgi:hypothetical protein
MQYNNKFFKIQNVPYKITRTTDKTIFYKCCIKDKEMSFNNGLIYHHSKNYYYHYSDQIDPNDPEQKMLKSKFINYGYQLTDNLNLDLYNYNETGYFNSLFFLDSNTLKSIYELQYEIYSYRHLFDLLYILRSTTSDTDKRSYFTETKQKIFQMISNDGSIVDKLLNYNNHLNPDEVHQIIDSIKKELTPKIEIETDCPICLEVKICEIGHFKCKHHLCPDCYKLLNKKFCCLCRST